jgi:hypothetical protein
MHFSYVSWVVSIKYGTIFEIRLCGKSHRFCTATRLSQAPWCILPSAAHRRNMRRPAAVTLIAAELGLASEQSLARRLVVILQVPTIWSPSRLYSPYSLSPPPPPVCIWCGRLPSHYSVQKSENACRDNTVRFDGLLSISTLQDRSINYLFT